MKDEKRIGETPQLPPRGDVPPSSSLLFLVGYRGTGKSTVARLLAQRLGWQWIDADAALEARLGRSIRQIFSEEGEAGFRLHEAAAPTRSLPRAAALS
jgi:shikimate kinase